MMRRISRFLGMAAARAAVTLLAGPSPAAAAKTILNPLIDPLRQCYQADGTVPYATGARLILNDSSLATHRTFFKTVPEIATSSDTGVQIILNESAGQAQLAVALIERPGGDRRIAFDVSQQGSR